MVDQDLAQRETDLARDAANKGGPAMANCHVRTKGAGTFAFAKRIDFGLTFIEQPFPMFCSEVDLDDADDYGFESGGNTPAGTPSLPQCTGYVTSWDTDDQGNWTGCWVAVSVVFPFTPPSSVPDTALPIKHYFTFAAVAIKDLSDNDEDAIPTTA